MLGVHILGFYHRNSQQAIPCSDEILRSLENDCFASQEELVFTGTHSIQPTQYMAAFLKSIVSLSTSYDAFGKLSLGHLLSYHLVLTYFAFNLRKKSE